jgi:uncharacterized membrane protein
MVIATGPAAQKYCLNRVGHCINAMAPTQIETTTGSYLATHGSVIEAISNAAILIILVIIFVIA